MLYFSRSGGSMDKIKIYVDSDGVVFNSIHKAKELGKKLGYDVESFDGFHKYFISRECDWLRLYATCGIINDAISKIKLMQKEDNVDVEILTKLCSHPHEPHVKRFMYNNLLPDIKVTMLDLNQNKSDVVERVRDCILIDDDWGNITKWRNAGGIGLLFCQDYCDLDNDVIDDLLKYKDTRSVKELLEKNDKCLKKI